MHSLLLEKVKTGASEKRLIVQPSMSSAADPAKETQPEMGPKGVGKSMERFKVSENVSMEIDGDVPTSGTVVSVRRKTDPSNEIPSAKKPKRNPTDKRKPRGTRKNKNKPTPTSNTY